MSPYPSAVEEFITAVQKDGWRTVPHPREWAARIAETTPEHIAPLVEAAIETKLAQQHWSLDAALSLLSLEDLPDLIEYALDALQQDAANESARSVIEFASETSPDRLQPYLHTLLALSEYAELYGAVEAWRGAEPQESYLLQALYENPEESERRRDFALQALFAMQNEPVLQALVQNDPDISLVEAGYAAQDGVLRRLFPDVAYHLCFPDDYPNKADTWAKNKHHTWHFPKVSVPSLMLGGMVDRACLCRSWGKMVYHLLTLAPVPEVLGITGLEKLTLAACLSCFTWENEMRCHVFYRHDSAGLPIQHIGFDGTQIVPQHPAGPLKPVAVQLTLTPRTGTFNAGLPERIFSGSAGTPPGFSTPTTPTTRCACAPCRFFCSLIPTSLKTTRMIRRKTNGSGGAGASLTFSGVTIAASAPYSRNGPDAQVNCLTALRLCLRRASCALAWRQRRRSRF